MKRIAFILTVSLLPAMGCHAQKDHKYTSHVIDKTNRLIKKKVKWTSLDKNERVNGYTRIGDSIFGGEIACNVPPLKGIDIKSFKVSPGSKYAKDKNHVYFPLTTNCVDYADCGVCYYSKVIVENANPASFHYLGKDYANDGKNVFFRGKPIASADGKTFKVLEGPEYFYFAVDKSNVYLYNKVFENADPSTFHLKKNDSEDDANYSDNKFLVSDKNNEWEYIPPDQIKKLEKK